MAEKLNKMQKAYIRNRARGLSRNQSAILAGYAADPDGNTGSKLEEKPKIQEELTRIRAETARNTDISKEDVVRMFEEAYMTAKLLEDPAGMVAAAREIGKMLGHFAPEVKKTLIGVDKEMLKKALDDMTDEELMKVANARTIDGQSKRVPDDHQLAGPAPTKGVQQLQD